MQHRCSSPLLAIINWGTFPSCPVLPPSRTKFVSFFTSSVQLCIFHFHCCCTFVHASHEILFYYLLSSRNVLYIFSFRYIVQLSVFCTYVLTREHSIGGCREEFSSKMQGGRNVNEKLYQD
jgi:hypothetical protein